MRADSLDLERLSDGSPYSASDRARNFPLYTPRQDLTRFLVRNELFRMIVDTHGSIVECGVFRGFGLMSWHHLSAIHEPYNHTRKVIGFDTFEGFPKTSREDGVNSLNPNSPKVGDMFGGPEAEGEIHRCVKAHDLNRPIGHVPKVELVKGDSSSTIYNYVSANPHLIVALLYLDFDLFEPTMRALQHLAPRVPRGGVIAFDELNLREWPGETIAYLESPITKLGKLQRFVWQSTVSYVVVR